MAQTNTHLIVKASSMPKEMLDKVVRFASSTLNEELNESVRLLFKRRCPLILLANRLQPRASKAS